jgi:hypothetical protein
MTEFAENLQLLVGTMGYKLFERLTKKAVPKQEQYFISAARGADATAIVTSEGMVVRKGSKIATSEVPSMPPAFHTKRELLIKDGVVKDFIFVKDNDELRGVLNSGHTRATAFVISVQGEEHEPVKFSTWGPKAIAK